MTVFAASRRSKNAIEACFGEALHVPRNFRAKKPRCSDRRDNAQPRGNVADPSEALDSDISDVRGALEFRDLARNATNGNISILKRQLGLVKAQLDLTKT